MAESSEQGRRCCCTHTGAHPHTALLHTTCKRAPEMPWASASVKAPLALASSSVDEKRGCRRSMVGPAAKGTVDSRRGVMRTSNTCAGLAREGLRAVQRPTEASRAEEAWPPHAVQRTRQGSPKRRETNTKACLGIRVEREAAHAVDVAARGNQLAVCVQRSKAAGVRLLESQGGEGAGGGALSGAWPCPAGSVPACLPCSAPRGTCLHAVLRLVSGTRVQQRDGAVIRTHDQRSAAGGPAQRHHAAPARVDLSSRRGGSRGTGSAQR